MPTPTRAVAALAAMIVLTLAACQASTSPSTAPAASPEPAASTGADTSTWTAYDSTDFGFGVSLPSDWDAFPREGEVWFSGGPPESWSSGITVHRYPADGLDHEAWIKANCGTRNGSMGNVADVIALPPCEPAWSSWTPTEVAGNEARWTLDDSCCRDVVVFAGEDVFVITATSSFAFDQPLFDAFLTTFQPRS